MSDNSSESTTVGFIIGVILCAFVNGAVMRDSIDLPNLDQVNLAISKCQNSKYTELNLKSHSGSWGHGYTTVKCTDGTIVEREVQYGNN